VSGALAYMMRRKDPNTNNPALTGMGMTAEQIMTPQGLDKLETILQMHGPMYYNVTYDPGEKSLTPNAAAKLSGLSVESYNRGVHAMHRQGRLGIYKR
jgi:hypothetical protein